MWQKLLIKILQALLFPLIDKLWDKVNGYLESKKKADEAKKKMNEAKTSKEIDDAADSTLDNI